MQKITEQNEIVYKQYQDENVENSIKRLYNYMSFHQMYLGCKPAIPESTYNRNDGLNNINISRHGIIMCETRLRGEHM